MKILFSLLLLLPTLVQANINNIIPKESNKYLGDANISITLQPWGGRVSSPGYKIIAFMDGMVIFDSIRNYRSESAVFKGVKRLQRKAEKFVPVLELIRKAKILNPKERLDCELRIVDAGGYTLTISNGITSNITYVNAACDKEIQEIFDTVRDAFYDAADVEIEIKDLRDQIINEGKRAKKQRNINKKCG